MKFLPFDNFKIYSSLSYDEVRQALEESITPKEGNGWSVTINPLSGKDYSGSITGDSFKITRLIKYQNSFLPIITGRFVDSYPGTTIEVKMRMSIVVYIFMCVWIGGVFAALVFTINNAAFASVIPAAMILVAYLVMIVAYRYEAGKAKKFLNEIFKAQIGVEGYDVQDPINIFIDEKIKGL